jgi:hypothetical protein
MHIPSVLTCRLEWHNCAGGFALRGREALKKVDDGGGGKDFHGRDKKEDGCIVLF